MKSTIISTTETTKTIKIEVASDMLEHVRKEVLQKLRSRVKAAGFRPGKAPDNIVERELGANVVADEVLEEAVNHTYIQALSEHQIVPVAHPDIKVEKYVPYTELEYSAVVDIMPEIKLIDYKKLKKKMPEAKVENSEIDATIEDLRKRLATKKPVDRAAKLGDEVNFDFDGVKYGQPVEGASAKGFSLELGSNTFIPGYEEEMVGLKPGDEKEFTITFPADYQKAELAGQPVTFKVRVNEVRETVLPEVNVEFATTVGPFTTVEELRADIANQIKGEKQVEVKRQFEEEVLDEIVAKSKLKVPEKLVDRQVSRMREELVGQLAQSGMDIENYLSLAKKSFEELEKELRPNAEKRVAVAMTLSQIAKQEDIKVSDEEVEAELVRLASSYQDPKMQAELQKPSVRDEIHNYLLANKTVTRLTEQITQA